MIDTRTNSLLSRHPASSRGKQTPAAPGAVCLTLSAVGSTWLRQVRDRCNRNDVVARLDSLVCFLVLHAACADTLAITARAFSRSHLIEAATAAAMRGSRVLRGFGQHVGDGEGLLGVAGPDAGLMLGVFRASCGLVLLMKQQPAADLAHGSRALDA
jgi:hypothetical protein